MKITSVVLWKLYKYYRHFEQYRDWGRKLYFGRFSRLVYRPIHANGFARRWLCKNHEPRDHSFGNVVRCGTKAQKRKRKRNTGLSSLSSALGRVSLWGNPLSSKATRNQTLLFRSYPQFVSASLFFYGERYPFPIDFSGLSWFYPSNYMIFLKN